MEEPLKGIVIRIREHVFNKGIKNINLDILYQELNIPKENISSSVTNFKDIIRLILQLEREEFVNIFLQYNFEGLNAIDILFIVGSELNKRFHVINPSMTSDLQVFHPDIYEEHIKIRSGFIYDKIKINISKGINQNMYRRDLDIEEVSKEYVKNIVMIHDAKKFPPENFYFHTIFDLLIEGFVKKIATTEGWRYYNSRAQLFGALGFGR